MRRWAGSLLGIAVLLLGAGSWGGPRQARAAGDRDVSTWVTLASGDPAVGCVLDASVEVRSGGSALAGAEALLGLVVDGEVFSADRGITDGDGITYLSFDTSEAWSGADAQIDVNIAGTYLGSVKVNLTDSGPCADDSKLWSNESTIYVPDLESPSAIGDVPSSDGTFFWAPTYVQQRNLSCEYASLHIATAALGDGVSEYDFDSLVGWSDNPHWGYRGDITGWWGNTDDYGVYPEALVGPLAQYGFVGQVFYGQGDTSELKAHIDAGQPTLVWLGLWGDLSYVDYTPDGTPFRITPGMHVVVAYGYDDAGIYVSDPAIGSTRFYDWNTFLGYWNVLDGMSLAVSWG